MLEKTIKRIVKRLWPELTGNLHLPQWAKIVKVHAIDAATESTPTAPGYCVDLQVLNSQGKPNSSIPLFEQVPLPATGAGNQRGVFIYPEIDTIVELGFILGQPNKPFIRTVLIEGLTVPLLGVGDVLLSKDQNNYYRIDDANNISEKCQTIAERIAATKQRLKVEDGGKMWVGNQSENLLALVSNLMAEMITLSNALAAHKHTGVQAGPATTGTADNASTYTGNSSATSVLKTKLDTFKE